MILNIGDKLHLDDKRRHLFGGNDSVSTILESIVTMSEVDNKFNGKKRYKIQMKCSTCEKIIPEPKKRKLIEIK